jgi:ribosomal protein L19
MAERGSTIVKKKGFYTTLNPKQYPIKSFFGRNRCLLPEIISSLHKGPFRFNFRKFKPGDVLDLAYLDLGGKKVRKFTGLCTSIVHRGGVQRFSLRNVLNNVGVELSFDLVSPSVVSLGKAQVYKPVSRSRSKLYYLRHRKATDSRV